MLMRTPPVFLIFPAMNRGCDGVLVDGDVGGSRDTPAASTATMKEGDGWGAEGDGGWLAEVAVRSKRRERFDTLTVSTTSVD